MGFLFHLPVCILRRYFNVELEDLKAAKLMLMMRLGMRREYKIAWCGNLGSISTQPLSGYMVVGTIKSLRISDFLSEIQKTGLERVSQIQELASL